MTLVFRYSIPTEKGDIQRLGHLMAQCFVSSDDSDDYFSLVGLENLRAVWQGTTLVGGLALLSMGQWWGGQCVPMTGIASVAIAPEFRGSGAATFLMRQTLKELHAAGVPISALYPAVQRLYRQVGYEQAGSRCLWTINPETIRLVDRSLPMQAIAQPLSDQMRSLYRQQAGQHNGWLDRHPLIWHMGIARSATGQPPYSYLVGDETNPVGYLCFTQARLAGKTTLTIRDWVSLTPSASQTLWAFLAGHRSQIDQIRWYGSPIDSMAFLLPEQSHTLHSLDRWMLRLVDVKTALELRGYPLLREQTLHLEVSDPTLPGNHRRMQLTVANGHATVTPGGTGDLKLGCRGLATLYSGLFSAYDLQRCGMLEGSDTALATAAQLFGSSSPWMPDFF